MDKTSTRENVSKIYCEKCDELFDSRDKYEKHSSNHSSDVSCQSCPIDIILEKIIGFFTGKNK